MTNRLVFGDPTSIGIARRAEAVAGLLDHIRGLDGPAGIADPCERLVFRRPQCLYCEGEGDVAPEEPGDDRPSCPDCQGSGKRGLRPTLDDLVEEIQAMPIKDLEDLCREKGYRPESYGLPFRLPILNRRPQQS